MEQLTTQTMADRTSPQISITLSPKTYEEFQRVARWKQMSLAKFVRQIVEREHESPSFSNLHRRALRSADIGDEVIDDDDE
ncbi:hypothetical protein [Aulosira sp. FACHB-615]|uniref:hypothetical protein n=1 Tax=Aulosira sp. FACHB-615 TaxID=2692777 RepID=UPI0016841927|nr:hypothetical protein [Aulosira sp. FACHB-615]MBD2489040.1 hypothetical protein [Aulosira sp. FACHB-615]